MDIKSKKWKSVVSYVLFVLGVSLLIGSVIFVLNRYHYEGGKVVLDLSEAFEEDYQNTDDFRREAADNLEIFLAMATGGPVHQRWNGYNNYYRSYYDYYDSSEVTYNATETVPNVVSEAAAESSRSADEESGWYGDIYSAGDSNYVYNENAYDDSYYGYEDEYAYTPEENEKAAKRAHRHKKDDKNVLYTITYEDKVVFDNTDGMGLDGVEHTMPEGYNFLLYFDGSKVTIIKDGKEIDVYQDGYYKDNSDWYVPGYKNFTVDEATKKATVCIAVAKEPMVYVSGNYASGGTAEQNNSMYWIAQKLKREKREYVSWIVMVVIAMACLLASVVFRKEKKKGDYFFGRITGKIWFEGKLLVLLLLLAQIIYYLGPISNKPLLIIIFFWLCYLLVNDVRYNKKIWEHGAAAYVIRIFGAKELKLTFQKKMARRNTIVLATGVTAVLLAVMAMATFVFEEEVYIFIPFILLLLVSQQIQIVFAHKNKEVAENIGALVNQVKAIRNGNLTQGMAFPTDADLSEAAQELNDIQQGMDAAVEEKIRSERMKVELVSNVSHDIKTPLTSIISYVELLKQEEDLPEHVQDYLSILDNKSQRLKVMIQDVFEVSKAVSGQLPVVLEDLDLRKLLWQTLADMEERIRNSTVTIKAEIPEEDIMIQADGQRLYRVFQNLIQNALQYSLEGSRVYVSLKTEGHRAAASVKNTSKYEISKEIDFTERFTRGDESRTDGGSGLGLSIARSFTEACGGSFSIEAIADLFVVTVEFEQID